MEDFNPEIFESDELTAEYSGGVWELLVEADNEFVPPLSERESSTQNSFTSEGSLISDKKPLEYFDSIKKQSYLYAVMKDGLAGFMTYRKNYPMKISSGEITCNYISTIIVKKNLRNLGITKKMYSRIIEISGNSPVATRTWSANHSHISILKRLGFTLCETIKNDRGEGIDTVYFIRYPEGETYEKA